jgi:hypothetical protein
MSRFLTKILNDRPGEANPKLEVVPKTDHVQTFATPDTDQTQTQVRPNPSQTKPKPKTSQTQTKPRLLKPEKVAPENDFNKRANVLERDALPNGLFPGASKAIYDALYLRTLGSINPKRTVQATRKELMKWSGVKNIKTINSHLKRLKELGLIGTTNFTGEQTGSHYEVFLPRKGDPDPTQTTQTGGVPEADQKTDSDQTQKTVWVGSGKAVDNKEFNDCPKTSLKTNTNDDEAFAPFIDKFQSATEELTGKKLSKRDAANLEKIADLLILELKIAARRTTGISSVPAFLTEVLRRQLSAARQQKNHSAAKSTETKIDTVGKTDTGSYEIKPLDEKDRQAALEQLQEFAADEFLQDFRKWYTEEDWNWLMKELNIRDYLK